MASNFRLINEATARARSAYATPINTAANAANQAVKSALAPIHAVALKAAQIRMQIEEYLIDIATVVNAIIDTAFTIYRILALGPGYFAEQIIKLKRKTIKEILTDIQNGIVQELKFAVGTLIGAISNVISTTVDEIESAASAFNDGVIQTFKDIDDITLSAYDLVKTNIEEETEVGITTGAAGAQLKRDLESLSPALIRNFNRDSAQQTSWRDLQNKKFVDNISLNLSIFRSPSMTQKEEKNAIKGLDKKFNDENNNLDKKVTDEDLMKEPIESNKVVNQKNNVSLVGSSLKPVDEITPTDNKTLEPTTDNEVEDTDYRKNLLTTRELYTLNLVEGVNNSVSNLLPLNETEYLDYTFGGSLPTRFKNLSGIRMYDQTTVFGSRDTNSIVMSLIKNNRQIYDSRFPDLVGNRDDQIYKLKFNRAINNTSDIYFEPEGDFNFISQGKNNFWNDLYKTDYKGTEVVNIKYATPSQTILD